MRLVGMKLVCKTCGTLLQVEEQTPAHVAKWEPDAVFSNDVPISPHVLQIPVVVVPCDTCTKPVAPLVEDMKRFVAKWKDY